jgi:hypothetical protein
MSTFNLGFDYRKPLVVLVPEAMITSFSMS